MKYDFTSLIDRHGMDAIAVDSWGEIPDMAPSAPDEGFDRIPMWVADMNFARCPRFRNTSFSAPSIPCLAISIRVTSTSTASSNGKAVATALSLAPEHIGYENGVLGGVVSSCAHMSSRAMRYWSTVPPTSALPTIEAAGYRIVHSPLKLDDQGVWRMDFEDMERKLAQNHIHAAVFCSPHNPCGRVWERDEIERAMDIYRQHDCVVISDEIWSDIILPGHKHIPTQSVSRMPACARLPLRAQQDA